MRPSLARCSGTAAMAGALVLGVLASGAAPAASAAPSWCPPAGTLTVRDLQTSPSRVDARACGLVGRKVRADPGRPGGVVVPPPGQQVRAFISREDGASTVTVAVAPDGAVTARTSSATVADQSSGARAAAVPADCADTYQPPFSQTHTPRDVFLTKTAPLGRGVSLADFRAANVAAATNLNANRNPCGVPDRQAVDLYIGPTTTRWPQVTRDAYCAGFRDNSNVVAFQALPDGILATACTFSTSTPGAPIVETDIGYNHAVRWWVAGARCPAADAFHLESVMTHEFGHGLGFGDLEEHPTFTMHYAIGPCSTAPRTLAAGEALALNAKY